MFGKAIIAVSLAATALAQNTFSIATPAALVQCQPVAVSWTGGTAPFILAVVPGGQPSAAALETLSTSLTSSPYTWVVNIAAGTSVTLLITDSTGVSVGNSALTIQPGSSSACLNSSASTSGVATTGAITTTGSGSATLSGTSSATGVTTTRSSMMSMSSASASSSAAGAASSASTSSASRASSSTPASSGGAATSAASARPSGAALPNAAAGLPAIAAGVVGAVAMLF